MPGQRAYNKPVPAPSPENKRYWDGCKKRELWLPFCRPCTRFFWYPRDFCPDCGSRDIDWRKACGRGVVYAFAIQYRAWHPGWAEEIPYVTALVDLEEGPRLFTNLAGIEPDPRRVRCGMPVEVVFDDTSEEITLPKFQPIKH